MRSEKDEGLIARGQLFEKWVVFKIQNKSISDILKRMGYKKIAIYGMGDIGYLLLQELKNTGIEIPYVIDRRLVYADRPVKSFEDEWERVDVIVITVLRHLDSIYNDIKTKCDYDVISLSDILSWG